MPSNAFRDRTRELTSSPRNRGFSASERWALRLLVPLVLATGLLLASRGDCLAAVACSAEDIVGHDPGCPEDRKTCRVTQNFEIMSGCVLDFRTKSVRVESTLRLSGEVILRAGALAVAPTGFLDGRGNDTPDSIGATVVLISASDIVLERSPTRVGRIETSGRGEGGVIDLRAGRSVVLDGKVLARGSESYSIGGEVLVDAGLDVSVWNEVDASGGEKGGIITVVAGRSVFVGGKLEVQGRYYGGVGGVIDLTGASGGGGKLTVSDTLNANGGPCGRNAGCGLAGSIALEGCDVELTENSQLLAKAEAGGEVSLSASGLLRASGDIDARTNAAGVNGTVFVLHPADILPDFAGGTIQPDPEIFPLPFCTEPGDLGCLLRCPDCGDGVVEFPETCDDGNASSCDGCSAFCRLENCDDGDAARKISAIPKQAADTS